MTQQKRKIEEEETVKHGDKWIWGIYVCLCIISIVESYSSLSQVVGSRGLYEPLIRHCAFLGSGFVILWVLQRIHYTRFITGIKIFSVLTFASVVAVLFIGENVNGALRAIAIPGLGTIQPAELAKLAIATLVPLIVSRNQRENGVTGTGAVLSVTVVVAFAAFLYSQGLTNTILLMGTSVIIMWVGGIKIKQLIVVGGVYAIVGGSFYLISKANDSKESEVNARVSAITAQVGEGPAASQTTIITPDDSEQDVPSSGRGNLRKNRIRNWIDNHDSLVYMPITKDNRQEMFAHMAQANGGVLGVGPGNSRECSRLPLAYSDYIYSIIVEETGLLGGIFVLLLYLLLVQRAGNIAGRCARAFPALLIMGMGVMITLQALVHIAINTGLFPVSGQPLPLISEGGTSVWVMSAAFGIMLSVSRHASQNTLDKMKKREEQTLPKEEQAPNPMQIIIEEQEQQ